MIDLLCILWDLALLALFLGVVGILAYLGLALSSFLWPLILLAAAAIIVCLLVR